MFQSVALSDEALNFWCEVWVVFFPIASRDVLFVCVLDDCVEGVHSCVHVCDGCTVHSCEVLFCFFGKGIPVGSFVICVRVSVASWGAFCFCSDDDGKVVRT